MLTGKQEKLLRGNHITYAGFKVGDVSFQGVFGAWEVYRDGKRVDVYTFSKMDDREFREVIERLFNTELMHG